MNEVIDQDFHFFSSDKTGKEAENGKLVITTEWQSERSVDWRCSVIKQKWSIIDKTVKPSAVKIHLSEE